MSWKFGRLILIAFPSQSNYFIFFFIVFRLYSISSFDSNHTFFSVRLIWLTTKVRMIWAVCVRPLNHFLSPFNMQRSIVDRPPLSKPFLDFHWFDEIQTISIDGLRFLISLSLTFDFVCTFRQVWVFEKQAANWPTSSSSSQTFIVAFSICLLRNSFALKHHITLLS